MIAWIDGFLWDAITHSCHKLSIALTKNVRQPVVKNVVDIRQIHDDVIKWKHFLRNWPFVCGIHRSWWIPQHKGQWRGALMFSLICVWIYGWVNNREAGNLRRHRGHHNVIVMICVAGYMGRIDFIRYSNTLIKFWPDRKRKSIQFYITDYTLPTESDHWCDGKMDVWWRKILLFENNSVIVRLWWSNVIISAIWEKANTCNWNPSYLSWYTHGESWPASTGTSGNDHVW